MSIRYVGARIAIALLQVAIVGLGVFTLTAILPGDTAVVVLGENFSEDTAATLRQQMGLDRPPHERFLEWAVGVLHGDFGRSLLTGVPVSEEIGDGLATTALLATLTLLVVIPLAAMIGIVSGLREGSRVDRALNTAILVLNAIPEFALGLVLIGVFSVTLGWLPATASGLSGSSVMAYPAVLLLPVVVLASKRISMLARQVRVGVMQATKSEYATHARMLGLAERTVVLKHVLPNAVAPALQQLARTVAGLLGGVVIVEALFAMPGMGSGFVDAVKARDLPLVQGYALVFALVTVTANLIIDLVVHRLVPQREAWT